MPGGAEPRPAAERRGRRFVARPAPVVVAGAGMAGLAAAVTAAEAGARVHLCEKGPAPGGSLALSAAIIWTVRDEATRRRIVPHGDAALGRTLVAEFPRAMAWLGALGVALDEVKNLFDYGHGYRATAGPRAVVDRLLARARALGVVVETNTAVVGLDREPRGAGMVVRVLRGGARQLLSCSRLILATGGFQGNREMVSRYIGPYGDLMVVRSNPGSVGDGLRLGLAAGAGVTAGMHAFYGHLLVDVARGVPSDEFLAATCYVSGEGLLLDEQGRRFTDESLGDAMNAQAVARQHGARAVLVLDAEALERGRRMTFPLPDGRPRPDVTTWARDHGATVVEAFDVDALSEALEVVFYLPAAQVRDTLRAYEAAATRGDATSLPVPRQHVRALVPPLLALAVRAAITFTHGGLRIDARARLLDLEGAPIPDLYAAGADTGGISYEAYIGGLAPALVFGRIAGEAAATA